MTRSNSLQFDEVSTIVSIVGECLELWADPGEWQAHLLRRTTALIHCRIGLWYEIEDGPDGPASRIRSAADFGWMDGAERVTLVEGLALRKLSFSPLYESFSRQLDRNSPRTLRQRQLIGDREWHRSEMYDSYIRPTRVGHGMMSGIWMPHRSAWSVWCLTNDRSDRPREHTERQQSLMSLLHQQIAPLIGTRLCTTDHRSIAGLTPLRRTVLAKLLAGDTEHQIAGAMHRSHAAIHEHVARLYAHFGVNSRSQLAAYFISRRPASDPQAGSFDQVKDWLERRRGATRH